MTKNKFLQQLEAELRMIPAAERADILHDYEEHFIFGQEEGKSEEEIAAALGSPAQIAKELLAGYHVKQASASSSAGSIVRGIWAVIGLSFFNLVVVLGPAVGIAGVIFAVWAVSLAFVASPLLVMVDAVFHPGTFILFDLFFSIGICGLGILVGMGMLYVTKLAKKALIGYLKYNVALVKGGIKHDN
jgi:Predicted membrane protein